MIPNKHDLTEEFPALSARLKDLDLSNPEFHALYSRYQEIDQEIIRFETKDACSDEHLENLKKQRLKLKDEIYHILTHL